MAVTITYQTGVATVGTTPPTAAQAAKINTLVATISPSSTADASATITHLLGMSNADITQGYPFTYITPLNNLASVSNWSLTSQNPNWTVFTKNNTSQGADTVPQVAVTIARPNTLVR
jgi:hypothetical protein